MTEWKIEETLETLSDNEKQIFITGLLDIEKKSQKNAMQFLAQKLGIWALAVGGAVSFLAGVSLKETSNTLSLLLSSGGLIASSLAIGGQQYLDLAYNDIVDGIKEPVSATKSIKYLKSKIKELDAGMEKD